MLWTVLRSECSLTKGARVLKAMDDIGVVMTPFGDVVAVSFVANIYVVGFFSLKSGVVEVYNCTKHWIHNS